jgi:broad specificity phosphatase PhoE
MASTKRLVEAIFHAEVASMNEFKAVTQVVLIRHGRTALNAAGRFRGHQDVPLDGVGRTEVEALAHRLKTSFNITQLLTSPLWRALDTADAIAEAFGLATVVEPRLIDLDFGNWEGLTPEEAAAAYPRQYRDWERIPQETVLPGGGYLAGHIDSALRLVAELIADYPGETVGLVTHEVVSQGLTCAFLGIPLRRFRRITQAPAGFSVFERRRDGWRIVTLNDTCHLGPFAGQSGSIDCWSTRHVSSATEVP